MDRALHHRENRTSSTPDKNVDVLQSDKLTFEQLAVIVLLVTFPVYADAEENNRATI